MAPDGLDKDRHFMRMIVLFGNGKKEVSFEKQREFVLYAASYLPPRFLSTLDQPTLEQLAMILFRRTMSSLSLSLFDGSCHSYLFVLTWRDVRQERRLCKQNSGSVPAVLCPAQRPRNLAGTCTRKSNTRSGMSAHTSG